MHQKYTDIEGSNYHNDLTEVNSDVKAHILRNEDEKSIFGPETAKNLTMYNFVVADAINIYWAN